MREIRTIKGYISHIKRLALNPVLSLKGFNELSQEEKDLFADVDGYICELAEHYKKLEVSSCK